MHTCYSFARHLHWYTPPAYNIRDSALNLFMFGCQERKVGRRCVYLLSNLEFHVKWDTHDQQGSGSGMMEWHAIFLNTFCLSGNVYLCFSKKKYETDTHQWTPADTAARSTPAFMFMMDLAFDQEEQMQMFEWIQSVSSSSWQKQEENVMFAIRL